MAPRSHRNMGWRKPVPRLSPESSTTPSSPPRGLQRLSPININKDMPPLPTDWRETMECAIKKERRQAVYVSTPPVPPPKDDESDSDADSSRPESAVTLVDEQEDATPPVPPPHIDSQPNECAERTQVLSQATPISMIARGASQKSLPKIYRPPTPPLPAEHPRLRPAGHSRASSESQTNTLYPGQLFAEQHDATPCPSVLTSWPSRLAPDASATLHSQGSRSHVLSLSGNDLSKVRGGASPHARPRSATSTSTGNRSSSRRSQSTCHMCYGVWYALKSLGLHLRAKMTLSTKY